MKEQKNPFPPKGVISLGGTTEQKLRTLPTEQLDSAARLAINYLEDGIGQIVTVSGPYGSGKTHLIHYAMEAVRNRTAEANETPRFVQVYAKTENAEFVSLYRQLIRQIGYSILREVNVRFLGVIALKELANEEEKTRKLLDLAPEDIKEEMQATYETSKQQVIERFRTNPEIVFKYLDNLIIQPETVLDARASELEAIAGENFKKAFFYLDDVDLGKTAYRWFIMEELSETDLRRLGVSKSLNTADEAKYALRLLVTLFKHAGIRLFIYIDQVEKLLIGSNQKTSETNAGQLHSLAEFFPRENAFLTLSGSEEGWEKMGRDFWSRIGPTQIHMEQITPEQSRALIKVYLQAGETYSPYRDPSEIAPFSLDAVDEILRLRGGNMRRFLQTCHEVYEKYLREDKQNIDPNLVRDVVEEEREFFDRKMVSDEIQRILRKKKVRFVSQVNLTQNFQSDFVIGDVTNPSAVIEISDALFYMDEAKKALRIVNFRTDLIKKFPKTRLILIVVGYVSSEVLNHLKGVVDDCIVYEGEGSGEKIEAVMDALATEEQELIPLEVDQKFKQELVEGIKESLQELLTAREKEIENLKARLEELVRAQAEERQKSVASQRQQEWRNWIRQDQERWEKRQAELKQKADDERKHLQEKGETLRLRQVIVRSILSMFSSIGMGLGVYFLALWYFLSIYIPPVGTRWDSSAIYNLKGLISIITGFLMAVSLYFLLVHRRFFPLGRLTNEIAKFSGDLGQLLLSAKTISISPKQVRRCLKGPNPMIRYFGALCLRKNILPRANWSGIATSETWKPLYLLYLELAVRTEEPGSLLDHLNLLMEANPDDPRIIHAISKLAKSNLFKNLNVEKLASYALTPSYGKVLAHAVFEHIIEPDRFGLERHKNIHSLLEFAIAYSLSLPDSRMSSLIERFRNRGRFWADDTKSPLPVKLTEEELRLIIDSLSPHREFGLASFYDLSVSNLYLRLYRFFAEIKWLADRGDVVLS